MVGEMFESFVFSEILKSYWHRAKRPAIYFYRDKDRKEIDLLIEENGKLYPIEIKKTAIPNKNMIKNFKTLNKLGIPIGYGGVVCMTEKHIPLTRDADVIPVSYL